ncbi:type 1 glutamine amidotransferase family protein [Bacillus carboniphilus]|uniref:Type 1 glutamine amidotransferase family protein n=1 Tax=Bacillus carboniphilus TaxID=86663 RepID=A0ABP3FZ64_9BACI
MRKILFFAYPQYADFEIGHPLFFLRKAGKAEITTVTVDGKPVKSIGGLVVTPQAAIDEVKVSDYDLVLISGGDGVHEVMDKESVQIMLREANEKGVPIAAICASAVLLGKAGLLDGKKFTCTPGTYNQFGDIFEGAEYSGSDIEVGDNWITAKGTAFPQFTVAVGHMLNIWRDEDHAEFALKFSRGEIG